MRWLRKKSGRFTKALWPDGCLEGITPNYLRLRVSAELVEKHQLQANQIIQVIVGDVMDSGDCAFCYIEDTEK